MRQEPGPEPAERAASDAAVVVPTHARPGALATCLAHLAALEGGPWPVVVVDDGSPGADAERYAEICAGEAALGRPVTLVRRANGGPGAARNTGARAAGGVRWLLFTDDDCRPRPDWARRLVAAQGGVRRRLIGGRIANALPGDPYASASQALAGYLTHHYETRGSGMSFFTTNNMCCLREDFLDLGGFDPAFRAASEDRDLSLRWRDAGGTLRHAPEAVVDHAHHLSARAFWRQHAAYGRGAHRLHRSLAGRGDGRRRLEAAGFYARLLLWPLSAEGRGRGAARLPLGRALAQVALLGVSQAATAAGYAAALREARAAPPPARRERRP
jgi:GT2 family glycosyltransferase